MLSEKEICRVETRWYADYLAITERIPSDWTVSKRDIDSRRVSTLEDENSVVSLTLLTSLLRSLSKDRYGILLSNKDPSLECYVDIVSFQNLSSILIVQYCIEILDHFASLALLILAIHNITQFFSMYKIELSQMSDTCAGPESIFWLRFTDGPKMCGWLRAHFFQPLLLHAGVCRRTERRRWEMHNFLQIDDHFTDRRYSTFTQKYNFSRRWSFCFSRTKIQLVGSLEYITIPCCNVLVELWAPPMWLYWRVYMPTRPPDPFHGEQTAASGPLHQPVVALERERAFWHRRLTRTSQVVCLSN